MENGNKDAIEFSYFIKGKGISRVDRILIRDDWMDETRQWDIKPSGLKTDDHAVPGAASNSR